LVRKTRKEALVEGVEKGLEKDLQRLDYRQVDEAFSRVLSAQTEDELRAALR